MAPLSSSSDRVVQSSLRTESDLTVIAPASFSFIGKLASGLGTEPLTELVSGSNSPVVLAPSMNRDLYSSDTLRSYLNKIKESGFHIVEPKTWELDVTPDQEAPLTIVIRRIISKVRAVLKEDQLLENRRILVTSGPTRDLFSQPSYTGGATSTSLGYSLSQQARQMGGEVTLVSGPTEQIPPTGVGVVWTRSVEELDELLTAELPEYDLILMASSASDWHPELNPNIFKEEKTKRLDLDIPETPDLARKLGRLKDESQVLIEFRVDSENEKDRTRESLVENGIDALFSLRHEGEGGPGSQDQFAGSFLFKSGGKERVQAGTGSRFSREILRKIGGKYFR
ncbi:MAG: phosphopantothenoylcysteine decarboxylase [Candidatus Bipolaricaulia bacterium]